MVRHPLHLSPPPPNRTGCSGMVLCLTELGSGDLFCWNVAKLPGVTEKEKGWHSCKKYQGLGWVVWVGGDLHFSHVVQQKHLRVLLGLNGHYRGPLGLSWLATPQPLLRTVRWAREPSRQKGHGWTAEARQGLTGDGQVRLQTDVPRHGTVQRPPEIHEHTLQESWHLTPVTEVELWSGEVQ